MEHSLFAAARVVAPYTGIALFKHGSISLVALACAGVYSTVWGLWEIFKTNSQNTSGSSSSSSGSGSGSGSGNNQKTSKAFGDLKPTAAGYSKSDESKEE